MERQTDKGREGQLIERQTVLLKDWQTDRKMNRQDSSTERWYGLAD